MSHILAPSVSLVDNRPATTSLAIADHFGKAHKNVLRDIEVLIADCPEDFARLNFEPSTYTNEQNKLQPMYHVFFDGFILLVMGYTGKKALKMKLAYIAAFNAMQDKLKGPGQIGGKPQPAQRRELAAHMPEYLRPLRELQLKHLEGLRGPARAKRICTLRMRLTRQMGVPSIWHLKPDQVEAAMAVLTPPIGRQQPWRDCTSVAQEAPKEPKAPPIKDYFRPHKQSDVPRGFDRLADMLRDTAMLMDELANMCDAYSTKLR